MYVTIRAYQGNTELADELSSREDEIKDVIGGIEGFRAYYLVRIAEGTATVSVFDTKEGSDASTAAAAAWIQQNLPEMQATPYVTSGEAVVSF